MLVWLVRHLFYLRSLFDRQVDSHQFALGCALGMMLGILPKGNLLALLLTMLIFSLRMHLGAAMISILIFSLVGYGLDPITHRLGLLLLTGGPWATFWVWLYELPLVPWTSLSNTVVTGSVTLGIIAAGPTYFLTRRTVAWLQNRPPRNRASQPAQLHSA